mgnify:CR=1 FL=1
MPGRTRTSSAGPAGAIAGAETRGAVGSVGGGLGKVNTWFNERELLLNHFEMYSRKDFRYRPSDGCKIPQKDLQHIRDEEHAADRGEHEGLRAPLARGPCHCRRRAADGEVPQRRLVLERLAHRERVSGGSGQRRRGRGRRQGEPGEQGGVNEQGSCGHNSDLVAVRVRGAI